MTKEKRETKTEIENIKQKYIEEYQKTTEELKRLGTEMGWMTDNESDPEGMFGPMFREMYGESTELETKRLNTNQDAGKSLEYLTVFRKWIKLVKTIQSIEQQEKDG